MLHPGEMGGGIGGALVAAGHDTMWASAGRSASTKARADAAGLRDVITVKELATQSELIFSVCPPHAAVEIAHQVAGFSGLYLDANAISSATAAEIANVIESAGGRFLDGGIIGSAPRPGRPVKIYLSGKDAAEFATILSSSLLICRALSDRPGDASSLKLAYAAWTKGTSALLLGILSFARTRGVEEALLREWEDSQHELAGRSLAAGGQAAAKGWRWVGEMEEIAKSFQDAGLPVGFHEGAAEIFRRIPRVEGAAPDQATLDAVLDALS